MASRPEGEIRLRPQTFRLLQALVEIHPLIVTKDELIDRVWGAEHVSSKSLSQAVSELRQSSPYFWAGFILFGLPGPQGVS